MIIRINYAEVRFSQLLDGLEIATRVSRDSDTARELSEIDADRLEQYAKRIRILIATKDKPVKVRKHER